MFIASGTFLFSLVSGWLTQLNCCDSNSSSSWLIPFWLSLTSDKIFLLGLKLTLTISFNLLLIFILLFILCLACSLFNSSSKNYPSRMASFLFPSAMLLFFQFFIRYFLHLHFKCYPESPLYPPPALLPNLPTPASWPWHSPVLGHMIFTRPRASPPIDLHMQLETQSSVGWNTEPLNKELEKLTQELKGLATL